MAVVGKDIEVAANFLKNGELVAIPTETVYGLAANGLNEQAVTQIFNVKERPLYNPLILHLKGREDLLTYVQSVPAVAEKLIQRFWPGPLTLLLPKRENVPDIITAKLPDVAVRVPAHPLTLALLQQLDFPLAAPSANPFCYISPTKAAHVEKQIGEKIPYILDGGACQQGLESTIVGFSGEEVIVYRLGAITLEDLMAVVGNVSLHKKSEEAQPMAPGMLPYHYAPKTPFYLTDDIEEVLSRFNPSETGLITLQGKVNTMMAKHVVLSESGDLQEAGSKLYDALHQLDALNLKQIVAEKFPDQGIGKTANERLTKAAGKATLKHDRKLSE